MRSPQYGTRFPTQFSRPRTFYSMEALYIKRNSPRPHSPTMVQSLRPRPNSPFINTSILPPLIEKSLVQLPDILQVSQGVQKPIIYSDDACEQPKSPHQSQIIDQMALITPETKPQQLQSNQLSVAKVQKSRSRAVSAARKRASKKCEQLEEDALRELSRMKIQEMVASK